MSPVREKIRVLVVEDSPSVQALLRFVLERDTSILLVGIASSGAEAVAMALSLRPDVITMDVHMPDMDGYEATRQIMEVAPCSIVIVSGSVDPKEVATTFRAVEAGAVAVLPRPDGPGSSAFEQSSRRFAESITSIADVQVSRGRSGTAVEATDLEVRSVDVIAIGASVGGPVVLRQILAGLPYPIPAPVLIVQHMAAGLARGFAEWLTVASHQPVRLALHDEPLSNGQVYLAPDGTHLGITPLRRIELKSPHPEGGRCPAVSYLFRTASEVARDRVAAFVLSGLGTDGAQDLALVRSRGGITVAQEPSTCVVAEMPAEAIRLGAARYVLAPAQIERYLVMLLNAEYRNE